jgi:hypothetical protein
MLIFMMLHLPLLLRLSFPVAPVAQTATVPLVPERWASSLVPLALIDWAR